MDLERCDFYIADLESRIANLLRTKSAYSGVIDRDEMLAMLQATLEVWRAYRAELIECQRSSGQDR
jgi:hypothetical protein